MSKEKRSMPKLRFPGFTEDWEQCKLGDLAEIVRGASPRPISDPKWFDNDSNVGWLRIADVTAQDGRIRYLEQKISELGQEKTRVIKTPHLLLSIAATVGKPVINYVPTGVHDGFLIFLNPKFNILYAFWWLEMFREKWNKYGQPGSQVNLNSDLVKNQVINIPNEKEQEKISSFLESLDKIITLHQRKLEHLNLKKKALLQKLFPKNGERYPELRFPGFTDAWEQRKFSEITYLSGIKNKENKPYESYSISNEFGFIPQNEQFEHGGTMKTADKSMYYIVTQNSFAYNPARINVGSIGYYDKPDNVIVSSLYEVFKTTEIVNDKFLWHWFKSNQFNHLIEKYQEGGVRLYFYYDKLCKGAIELPTIDEQNKISNLLNGLDLFITLHQRKLEHLQLQKKALLQQMFV